MAELAAAARMRLQTQTQGALYNALMQQYGSALPGSVTATFGPFSTGFAAQYAPAVDAAYMKSSGESSQGAFESGAAMIFFLIGAVLWTYATIEKRNLRSVLMLLGCLFFTAFAAIQGFIATSTNSANAALLDAGIIVCCLALGAAIASSALQAVAVFGAWMNKPVVRAGIVVVITALVVTCAVILTEDFPDCGYVPCTLRSRILPIVAVLSYLLMSVFVWVRGIWTHMLKARALQRRSQSIASSMPSGNQRLARVIFFTRNGKKKRDV